MEADLTQLNSNGDCMANASTAQLLSRGDSFYAHYLFGDPQIAPRVGDEYQVEIPSLVTDSEYVSYVKNPVVTEFAAGIPSDFLVGLPISVMWIKKDIKRMKHEDSGFLGDQKEPSSKNRSLNPESNTDAHIWTRDVDLNLKVEPLAVEWTSAVGPEEYKGLAVQQEMDSTVHQKHMGKGYCLVPGSLADSWSDVEEASFILGLYIFGKNLVQVKRFIENKTMGTILSFYYGKFYRSEGYHRWSECRKMRSRKLVHGQRIFSGLRQQELFSRLSVHVSEECQNTLSQVSKAYAEGKMSLEEYVSMLKAIVGMKSLVEAVGIGKGKQDLTGTSMEPTKSSSHIAARPEVPVGKACSSLTPTEIVKFLTGDFRLSKARSNDLFWEAVWPRLLARGWHSEQPKHQSYATSSKHSLVFLIPGVKKFSRRRLVKGNDYFDSVTDVLNKVASDPSLLELDTETDENNRSKEWTNEIKLEQDDSSCRQNHCYLQPRTPSQNADLMKFTIVDTSMAHGKPFKVRESGTLLVEISNTTTYGTHSEGSNGDTSESADRLLYDQEDTNHSKPKITTKRMSFGWENPEENFLNQPISISSSNSAIASISNSKNGVNLLEDNDLRKQAKSSKRPHQDHLDHVVSPAKKRHKRLASCNHGIPSASLSMELDKQSCCSDTLNSSGNNLFHNRISQKRISSITSSNGSPVQTSEAVFSDSNFAVEHPSEKPTEPPRTLIDLNLPQAPLDFETNEALMIEARGQDGQPSKEPNDAIASKPSLDEHNSSEQQPCTSSRRQSTRNRPPTMKALEALANGFLTISNRKRKDKVAARPRVSSRSRPSQTALSGIGITDNVNTVVVPSPTGEAEDDACTQNTDVSRTFYALNERDTAAA